MGITRGTPLFAVLFVSLYLLAPVSGWAKCFCANGYDGCACGDIDCCKRSMGIISPTPNTPSAPSYNYEAERQRQEQAAQERARVEEARRKQEEAERQAKFDREKREAAATLKGVSSGGNELKGISGTNSHGLKGLDSGAGAQLKSVEQHSRQAERLDREGSSNEARKGFDTPGKGAGTLVYPNISGKKPAAPSVLASKVPAAAQNDPEVKSALAWYNQLDKVKAETKQKIAEAEQKQKSGTGDKAALSAHVQTLNNQLKDAEQQQAKTEEKVKTRVRNLGFSWNEAPSSAAGSNK